MARMKPKTIVERAREYLDSENHRELMNSFLTKFSEIEVYTRPYLEEYYRSIGEDIDPERIGLERETVLDAFSEAGIYFDDKKQITRIFGASDKVNESSCRWLRNKITHSLMLRAIREVCERSDQLIDDMDSFIEQVENQS